MPSIVSRTFSSEGVHPYDQLTWAKRDARITNQKGEILFELKDAEFPTSWSDNAVNIVASKYFAGNIGGGHRETSLKQLIDRVVGAIGAAGFEQKLFATYDEQSVFEDELRWLLVNQYGSFNSPVWFNVGLNWAYGLTEPGDQFLYGWEQMYDEDGNKDVGLVRPVDPYVRPQASACFIISVDDSIEGIWNAMSESARLFKYGSGIGADWSNLRSTRDRLSGGGQPSGPVSFMRVQDSTGSTIKSGGKTRRAAIMQTLKSWHPDVAEFIGVKMAEEKKAHALIDAGYDGSFNGEAYATVAFQNVNQSVRVDDAFMRQIVYRSENDSRPAMSSEHPGDGYTLRSPATGEALGVVDPEDLLDGIAEGTWFCGDPGVQYEDTIQRWHTCKNTGPINSSNPCSEYMFLDNSACNLASLNLKKFIAANGYSWHLLDAAARVFLTAQEILVDLAGYPSAAIAENSHKFRPLGLGFANLGATLMALGLPYDSVEGRSFAGAVMGVIHGGSNVHSAVMANVIGPFEGFAENRDSFINVMKMHADAADRGLQDSLSGPAFIQAGWRLAETFNSEAVETVAAYGSRNAQVTVLAPTGTISFMMDCDTTGIEPELALVKYKLLAGKGDGLMKIVNQTVVEGLRALKYSDDDIKLIAEWIEEKGYADGCPHLRDEHQSVFDTSFQPQGCSRVIPWEAHLTMMAACQPFVSGAISKTVNMPASATVEDIKKAYTMGWYLGLKAVAIYRDGSKRTQPLSTSLNTGGEIEGQYASVFAVDDELHTIRVATPEDAQLIDGIVAAFHVKVDELMDALDEKGEALSEADHKVIRAAAEPARKRIPEDAPAIRRKFSIAGHEGYLHVGLYPDTMLPGEIFIRMSKEGSTLSGMMDSFATAISIALQYGVPIDSLVRKFSHVRFDPAGFTGDKELPMADSVIDYIFRFLDQVFVSKTREHILAKCYGIGLGHAISLREVDHEDHEDDLERQVVFSNPSGSYTRYNDGSIEIKGDLSFEGVADLGGDGALEVEPAYAGPPCGTCGGLTVPSGSCYSCTSCGSTTGCG